MIVERLKNIARHELEISFRIWSLVGRYILQNSKIDREKISFKPIHIVVVAIVNLNPH